MTETQSFRDGLPKNPQMDKNEMIKTNFSLNVFADIEQINNTIPAHTWNTLRRAFKGNKSLKRMFLWILHSNISALVQ